MISPKILLPLSLLISAALAEATWQNPRTGAVVMADGEAGEAEVNPRLPDALTKLKELGIVSDTEYWLAHARRGKSCEGGQVAEVMINAAKKFEPSVTEIEAAVNVLTANKILQNKDTNDYWKKRAVMGQKCSGNFVAQMLIGMSDVL